MRIAIAGGSGLVGSALVKALLERGHEPAIISRSAEAAPGGSGQQVARLSWGDPEGRQLARALEGFDAVVNLAGERAVGVRYSASTKQRILDSRVGSTRTLVAALQRLSPSLRPGTLLSASAVGYYGTQGDEWVDESSAPGKDFLAEVCLRWEAEAARAAQLGVRVVVPRLGIVLSSLGGALPPMVRATRWGLGGVLGTGRQWVSWIHVEDVCAVLCACLVSSTLSGPLNLVAPEPVTNAQLMGALRRGLSRSVGLPAPAAAVRFALGEGAEPLLGGQRVARRRGEGEVPACQWATLEAALGDLLGG